MKKPRWILVPVAVGVLALAIVGGTAFAHGGDSEDKPQVESIPSRVATILELDEETVQDALQQARMEMQSDMLQNRLNHLVEDGKITQEQADDYLGWYESKPEGLPNRFSFGGNRGHRQFRGFMLRGHGRMGGGFGDQTGPAPEGDLGGDPT